MGLFDRKQPENENIVSTQTTPADQHIINEVQSDARTKGVGGGTVERLSSNSEELQKLLNEFKAMQGEPVEHNGYENHEHDSTSITEEYSDEHHSVEEGEKYTLSAEENNQIEKYLVGEDVEPEDYISVEEEEEPDFVEISDDDDVIYIDEQKQEQDVAEEYIEEEPIEEIEEVVEEEFYDDTEEELMEEEYSPSEIDTEELEENVEEEYIDEGSVYDDSEEYIEEDVIDEDETYADEDNNIEEYIEDEIVEDVVEEYFDDSEQDGEEDVVEDGEEESFVADEEDYSDSYGKSEEENNDSISEEDIDKKLDAKLSAFEEQLLSKLMATINMTNQNSGVQSTSNVVSEPVKVDENIEAEDLNFEGQVVIFEPLEKIKQATWEDVVRRKGHYTYHVTASSNGGWFIKRAKSPNPYAYLENKEEAMKLAIVYAKREKAELKLHNEKGVIETSMSFGREKKIN